MKQFKEGQIVYSTEEAFDQYNIPIGSEYYIESIQYLQTKLRSQEDYHTVRHVNSRYLRKLFTTTKPTTMNNRFPFQLKSTDAQRIINIACPGWRLKLASVWGRDIALSQDIIIGGTSYKEMRRACTSEQHKLFDEIFGKDETEFKLGEKVIDVQDHKKPSQILVISDIKNNWIECEYPDGLKLPLNRNWLRHATSEEIKEYEQSQGGIFTDKGIDALIGVIEMNITNLHVNDYNKIPGGTPPQKAKAISKLIYDTWCK